MHWTEERTAKVRIGQALRARGWTILGFKEDRSDPMTDTYDPESWDGVATHPTHPGIVACVKVGEYVVERTSGQDGWPNFQATLSGKAWHVQKDGVVVGQGVGLSRCAGHGDDWHGGVAGVCDAIERAAREAAGATPPISKAGSATLQGRVQVEHDRDWTWVFFSSRPDEATRERLKGMGARWGRKRGGWYLTRHVSLAELAWLTAGPQTDPTPDSIQPQPGGFHPTTAQEALERARFVYDHQPPRDQQDAHDYLPHWLAPHIPRLYDQDGFDDPVVFAKAFLATGRWTFYILEYDHTAPDGTPDLMFGYLLSPLGDDCDELCYVTLEQIRKLNLDS